MSKMEYDFESKEALFTSAVEFATSDTNDIFQQSVDAASQSSNEYEADFREDDCCYIFTKNQVITAILLAFSSLSVAHTVSLFPPFYPKLAEEKNTPASIYGFVLGINSLIMFITSPFIGKHLKTIGIKFAFTAGLLINGVCVILSGFLENIRPGPTFICFSILIRVVQALGSAAFITASFTIMALEFPKCTARIFGITKILMNIGLLTGPALGGALYKFGGFKSPFVSLGAIQIAIAIASFIIQQSYEDMETKKEFETIKTVTIFNILKIPSIWIPFCSLFVSTLSSGFLSVTLEAQVLRRLNLDHFYMGLLYGLKDGANSLSTPIWGWLCDQKQKIFTKVCLILSGLIACISYMFLVPNPPVHGIPIMWVIIIGLALNGIGTGGLQIGAVIDALEETRNAGFCNDPNMYGCIVGLWSSFSGFGRFISRSLSGILIDHIGFQNSTIILLTINGLVTVTTSLYVTCNARHTVNNSEIKDSNSQSNKIKKMLQHSMEIE